MRLLVFLPVFRSTLRRSSGFARCGNFHTSPIPSAARVSLSGEVPEACFRSRKSAAGDLLCLERVRRTESKSRCHWNAILRMLGFFRKNHYICCNQVGFIWLSTDWIKLARERAMDKKKPDCSEPPYFSCFQITLYLTCKDNTFFLKKQQNKSQSVWIHNHESWLNL